MHYFLKMLYFNFGCFSPFNDVHIFPTFLKEKWLHTIAFNDIFICCILVSFSITSVRFPLEIFQIPTVTISYAVRTEGLD
jgi:hypothetical protein